MSRKWIIGLSIVGGVLLVLVVIALSIPDAPLQTEDGIHTLALGPITVQVDSTEPAAEDPDQFVGVRHQGPDFDTAPLGEDLNLVPDSPDFAALESEQVVRPDRIVRAVYLGDDTQGVPVYVYSEGSTHIGNLIAQLFLDEGTLFRFGFTYACCLPGPVPENSFGLASGIDVTTSVETDESVLVTGWHALPAEVSVVAILVDGVWRGWLTPTSGTAAFRLSLPDKAFQWETEVVETDTGPLEIRTLISTIELVAFDSEGKEIART